MNGRTLHMLHYVSPAEAVANIASGQRVFVQGAAATPHVLLDALVARSATLKGVEMVHLHLEGAAPHAAPEVADAFRINALFVGANVRQAVAQGRADYMPVFLSEIPALFLRGTLPLDVALVHVSPPDTHGFCSLGTSVDVAAARSRRGHLTGARALRGHRVRRSGKNLRTNSSQLLHPNIERFSPPQPTRGLLQADDAG
jgi:4-hydroxybutyrate CoA-transferase